MAIKTETKIHDFRINSLSAEAYNDALANKQILEDELYLVEEELTPEQILNHINMSEQTYKVKTYTTLEQLGLSTGSETIESILTAMPVNSILQLTVGANHAKIYPTQYGMLVARKDDTSRWFAEFYPKETTDLYVCSAKIENSTFALYEWKKKADTSDIDDLKKSVSDGKTLVANAITAKGVTTATDATFQTMADNVESIITLDSVPHTTPDGTINDHTYIEISSNGEKTSSSQIIKLDSIYPINKDGSSTSKALIAYGNGKFIIAGYVSRSDIDSSLYTLHSVDGINWIPHEHAFKNLFGLEYGNGKFVISDSLKTMYYSEDGISWEKGTIDDAPIALYTHLKYVNNKFFSWSTYNKNGYVTSPFSCIISEDGINWTNIRSKLPSNSYTMLSITYGNGIYGAILSTHTSGTVDETPICVTSSDGINWDTHDFTSSLGTSFIEISYIAEKFVAVSIQNNKCIYSEDFISWNEYDANIPTGYTWNKNVSFVKDRFFINDDSGRYIAYSKDGLNWNVLDLENENYNNENNFGCYGNGYYVTAKNIAKSSNTTKTKIVRIGFGDYVLCELPNNTYIDGVDYAKVFIPN